MGRKILLSADNSRIICRAGCPHPAGEGRKLFAADPKISVGNGLDRSGTSTAARGLCARRRISEANRGSAPALRPEMAALLRGNDRCVKSSHKCAINFMPARDVEDAVPYKLGKVWHRICKACQGVVSAWSGDHALQNGRVYHKFCSLQCRKAPRDDASIVPYGLHQALPSPPIPNFSFLIPNYPLTPNS